MKDRGEERILLPMQANLLKPADRRKLAQLLRKTQVDDPKPGDLNALRRLIEETPDLWSAVRDLANLSAALILHGEWLSPAIRTMIDAGQAAIRSDLGYQDAPALERMLIDQLIITWLQLRKTQIRYETVQKASPTLSVAGYWERKLTAAQTRFLRAGETLTRVRKLSRPSAVQVNIGARQLNIAQGVKNETEVDDESGQPELKEILP